MENVAIFNPHLHETILKIYTQKLSQCAARRTRHRAFYFGGGRQVGELKNQPKRNPKAIAKQRDDRQMGERKKQPRIHPKTTKNH